ncbi:AMP-binding protein, partial [Roseibium sp. RKSG952]|uniref:AMP-binding protein n=1 Tax=Roseibium sp. RKSG952 TaxID=2529384 RepID=UPI0012BC2A3A
GGAYLPLDPAYPQERLAFMLEDAGAGWVVTNRILVEAYPCIRSTNGHQSVVLDHTITSATVAAISKNPIMKGQLLNRHSHNSLSYVIYTSGSTGKPKAIVLGSACLSSFIHASQLVFSLDTSDRIILSSNQLFDAFIEQICLSVAFGCSLIIADPRDFSVGDLDGNPLNRIKPTFIDATPTLWQSALSNGFLGNDLRIAVSGGEPLTPEVAHALPELSDMCINTYGPAECTIAVTSGCIADQTGHLTIGKPLSNTQAYVVDA